MNYYISDLHFGCSEIADRTGRTMNPLFQDETGAFSMDRMNDVMIQTVNDHVGEGDVLYILGDVSCYYVDPVPFLRQIRAKKVLIRGNHDAKWVSKRPFQKCFLKVLDFGTAYSERGQRIVLCHYPLADWDGRFKGHWHFHGHVHNNNELSYDEHRVNVSADVLSFIPMTADELMIHHQVQQSDMMNQRVNPYNRQGLLSAFPVPDKKDESNCEKNI